MKRATLLTTTALLCALAAPARADIIDITYTGLASGFDGMLPCPPCGTRQFSNAPYTETFEFDTTLGTLTTTANGDYDLVDGLVFATVNIPGVPAGAGATGNALSNELIWSPDGSFLQPNVGSDFMHITANNYQWGTCPDECGGLFASNVTFTDTPAPVPGPVVGGGLPGLLGLGLLLLNFIRRKFQ